MAAPIDIIKYPFSGGAALNRSFSAPDIIHKISGEPLSDYISCWKDIEPDSSIRISPPEGGLRNIEAVTDAVIKLGNQILHSQMQGHIPFTLGGDHTQAISTLKTSALTHIIKLIENNKIALNSQLKIDNSPQKNDTEALAQKIRDAIKNGHVHQNEIDQVLDQIAVIWIDSHPDYNDRQSSSSGNIHGMALASSTGKDIGGIENLFGGDFLCLNPKNFYILCARDIDDAERAYMNEDGVNYKNWELTHPGAMRTVSDPDNPKTLKDCLSEVMKSIADKKIILSLDVDAIHAAPHESPYGLESVAATGTPMGLRRRDMSRAFDQVSTTTPDEDLIRLNTNNESPAGPSAGDVFETLHNVLNHPNLLAADLTEASPAAGRAGMPVAEQEHGLTLQTSMKLMAAMLGADLQKFSKELKDKKSALDALVKKAIENERKN